MFHKAPVLRCHVILLVCGMNNSKLAGFSSDLLAGVQMRPESQSYHVSS